MARSILKHGPSTANDLAERLSLTPAAVRRHLGVDAAHAYGGFMAHLTAWCEQHGVPYAGVPVGTIKRFVTGKGNADKAAVIAAVRALGYFPVDDNEADALALLACVLGNSAGKGDVR